MRPRLLAALAGSVLLTAALTACATPAPGAAGPGAPVPGPEVAAGWVHGGAMIALVTYGSSTCVPELGKTTAADGVLEVALRAPDAEACTKDMVPQPIAVAVPEGIDPAAGVRLRVALDDEATDVDLAGYTGDAVPEFTPSAGWLGDDAIALLTWGSSSCPPVVDDVAVASAASIVVRFATPSPDQVCTMDMAPQLTVAQLDPAVEVDRDAVLTLGLPGSESEIPIG